MKAEIQALQGRTKQLEETINSLNDDNRNLNKKISKKDTELDKLHQIKNQMEAEHEKELNEQKISLQNALKEEFVRKITRYLTLGNPTQRARRQIRQRKDRIRQQDSQLHQKNPRHRIQHRRRFSRDRSSELRTCREGRRNRKTQGKMSFH
jgi:hypothetical protein